MFLPDALIIKPVRRVDALARLHVATFGHHGGAARPRDRLDSGPDQQGGPASALAPITQIAPPELDEHRQHPAGFRDNPNSGLGHGIIRSAVTLRDQLGQPTLRVRLFNLHTRIIRPEAFHEDWSGWRRYRQASARKSRYARRTRHHEALL